MHSKNYACKFSVKCFFHTNIKKLIDLWKSTYSVTTIRHATAYSISYLPNMDIYCLTWTGNDIFQFRGSYYPMYCTIQVYQGWIFISGNFYFSFDSTSLTYISIPKNKRKTKITWDKKINYNIYLTIAFHKCALDIRWCRTVTKISSCWVYAISRRGIAQKGSSFGSVFLLFPMKVAGAPAYS